MSNGNANRVDPEKLDSAAKEIGNLKKKLDTALATIDSVVKGIVGVSGKWTDEIADEFNTEFRTWKQGEQADHTWLFNFSPSITAEAAALRKAHKVK